MIDCTVSVPKPGSVSLRLPAEPSALGPPYDVSASVR